MKHLAKFAMDAHAGLDRWRQLKTVSGRLLNGGVLLETNGPRRDVSD